MRPASLFRAHQVGYSWIVWCEACPTSFYEILSPLHHEAFRPQIFLTFCFGAPYCEAYMGRASVPPRGAGKEEEERETETSELARGLPPCLGQETLRGEGGMTPPWRFSLSRSGVPRREVPLPLLQCRTR